MKVTMNISTKNYVAPRLRSLDVRLDSACLQASPDIQYGGFDEEEDL